MSRMLKSLKQAIETKNDKYHLALEGHAGKYTALNHKAGISAQIEAQKENLNGDSISLNKNIFYLVIGAAVLLSVIALILSFKTISRIETRNAEVAQLNSVINDEKAEIKELKDFVQVSHDLQTQETKDLRMIVKSLMEAQSKGEQALYKLMSQTTDLQTAWADLKSTSRKLVTGYIDLNKDIKRLKILVVE